MEVDIYSFGVILKEWDTLKGFQNKFESQPIISLSTRNSQKAGIGKLYHSNDNEDCCSSFGLQK